MTKRRLLFSGAFLLRLTALAFASEADLVGAALPRKRARLVRAAFELARSAIGEPPRVGARLSCSADVWVHMRASLAGLPVEEFWAIALDVRHRVLFDARCGMGSLTGVEVHPRDIFRRLMKVGAAAAIFCHYVARHIMRVLCPVRLCGGAPI